MKKYRVVSICRSKPSFVAETPDPRRASKVARWLKRVEDHGCTVMITEMFVEGQTQRQGASRVFSGRRR